MKLPSKQYLYRSLVVAMFGGALATAAALAQSAGTAAPSPSRPAAGAGTAAPPSPVGAQPSGTGTATPPTPLGNGVVTPASPPAQTPAGAGVMTGGGPMGAAPVTETSGAMPTKREISSMAFDKLDPDKRGFVTRAQLANLPGFETAFEQADANKDGQLSEDEFNNFWTAYSRQP